MSSAIVLATTAENAEALLSGERDRDQRRFPPKKLPARAYLAALSKVMQGDPTAVIAGPVSAVSRWT